MIILCEGPRGAGKSHLVNGFFRSLETYDTDPFLYYKFNFTQYLKELELFERFGDGPEVHYFSISNIFTIFEMAQDQWKNRIVVMDRSLFSAYVWSIYRNRMNRSDLMTELYNFIMGPVYRDAKIVYIKKSPGASSPDRGAKDDFDQWENYDLEREIYDRVFSDIGDLLRDSMRGNSITTFENEFDLASESRFNALLNSMIDK